MATSFKKPSSLPSVTTLADTDLLPAMTSAGAFKKLSWANLKSIIKSAVAPDTATATAAQACDSVMIVMTSPTDATIRYGKVETWPTHKASGYNAIGVLVNDGNCRVIVALDECASAGLHWSSATGDIPDLYNYTSAQKAKMLAESTDGAANTAAILAASSASMVTNTTDYAAGFCNAYSKTAPYSSSDGKTSGTAGIAAGKWYLPSMRELWAIYTHLNAVQYALNLVGGAEFSLTGYWSSTESSAYYAWYLNFYTGYLSSGNSKATSRLRVRPCAAFS